MSKIKIISILTLIVFPLSAFADNCSATIEGNDIMQYNTNNITVDKTCKEFKVTLKHTGKLPKNIMGHNWVLTKTSDMTAVGNDGVTTGPDKDFLKANDTRVVAHTKLIGGGESDTVTIPLNKLNPSEQYSFFCTFPAHMALMKGTLSFK